MCARMGLPTLSSAITLPLLGYKYFNFTSTFGRRNLKLVLNLIPEGVDGTITVMADRPWASQGGIVLGSLELKADMSDSPADFVVDVPALAELTGKHAIYLKFTSEVADKSICVLNNIKFK